MIADVVIYSLLFIIWKICHQICHHFCETKGRRLKQTEKTKPL